jgi:alpha,alpha-trehalose phosphorylase
LTYRVTLHGARVRVQVEREQVTLTLETGEMARLVVRGKEVQVTPDEPVVVPLDDQGPRLPGGPPVWGRDGVRRADGTVITASVPRPSDGQDPLAD